MSAQFVFSIERGRMCFTFLLEQQQKKIIGDFIRASLTEQQLASTHFLFGFCFVYGKTHAFKRYTVDTHSRKVDKKQNEQRRNLKKKNAREHFINGHMKNTKNICVEENKTKQKTFEKQKKKIIISVIIVNKLALWTRKKKQIKTETKKNSQTAIKGY